jgi:hypothetical protein
MIDDYNSKIKEYNSFDKECMEELNYYTLLISRLKYIIDILDTNNMDFDTPNYELVYSLD